MFTWLKKRLHPDQSLKEKYRIYFTFTLMNFEIQQNLTFLENSFYTNGSVNADMYTNRQKRASAVSKQRRNLLKKTQEFPLIDQCFVVTFCYQLNIVEYTKKVCYIQVAYFSCCICLNLTHNNLRRKLYINLSQMLVY